MTDLTNVDVREETNPVTHDLASVLYEPENSAAVQVAQVVDEFIKREHKSLVKQFLDKVSEELHSEKFLVTSYAVTENSYFECEKAELQYGKYTLEVSMRRHK